MPPKKKLAAVRTMVATGRTRQVRGDILVPIEFEMSIQLPDRYIRKDEIPAQANGPSTTGFNGETIPRLAHTETIDLAIAYRIHQ